MKKQLSDEQLDAMMRTLMRDAALHDNTVDEIADSPSIWWSVQRGIARQQKVSVSPWPPIGKYWRWIAVGVPAAAVLAIVIGVFVSRPTGGWREVAGLQRNVSEEAVTTPPLVETERADTASGLNADRRVVTKPKIAAEKPVVHQAGLIIDPKKTLNNQTTRKSEIKTDFIALSYSRNPDSGEIVRVKVPSSMMITLGLVTSVENPSNLVDAEVLVGDDGLTRAIRFIR